jgi:hypothetical protein
MTDQTQKTCNAASITPRHVDWWGHRGTRIPDCREKRLISGVLWRRTHHPQCAPTPAILRRSGGHRRIVGAGFASCFAGRHAVPSPAVVSVSTSSSTIRQPWNATYAQAALKSGIFQSPISDVSARSSQVLACQCIPVVRDHAANHSRASGPNSATRRGRTRVFNTGPVTSHAEPTRSSQAPEHLIRRKTSPTVRPPP